MLHTPAKKTTEIYSTSDADFRRLEILRVIASVRRLRQDGYRLHQSVWCGHISPSASRCAWVMCYVQVGASGPS